MELSKEEKAFQDMFMKELVPVADDLARKISKTALEDGIGRVSIISPTKQIAALLFSSRIASQLVADTVTASYLFAMHTDKDDRETIMEEMRKHFHSLVDAMHEKHKDKVINHE